MVSLASRATALFSLLLAAISSGLSNGQEINIEALQKEGVIPTVIDMKPTIALQVKYKSGVEALYGNELTPTQVKDMPKFEFRSEADKLYTIAFIGPDVPTLNAGMVLGMMIHNIPGNDVAKGNINTEYVGSAPPEGSGFHRYVFILYEQPGKVKGGKFISRTTGMARVKFSLKKYAADHKLGKPVGINFYKAQYDDYVPKIWRQFMTFGWG